MLGVCDTAVLVDASEAIASNDDTPGELVPVPFDVGGFVPFETAIRSSGTW